jgi:NhaA family Na+:H+ antiporter
MSVGRPRGHYVNLLQEFSVPLLAGVVLALLTANLAPNLYHQILEFEPLSGLAIFGHPLTFHFLVNDIFMVFFFAIAAKEITEASLPGGLLNPISKAVSPLVATAGGVMGPVVVFFVAIALCFHFGIYSPENHDRAELANGWGIPTATDIALAWLVARAVFGKRHPAVVYLLLLAVADDAIGLVIIAVFYGDPTLPAEPIWLVLTLVAMGVAFGLKRANVRRWEPYVVMAGPLAWSGLVLAHLHPALALAFVVPFIPGPARDTGLFEEHDEVDDVGILVTEVDHAHSPLHLFEQQIKTFVDFGLLFFAFANAGVELADVGPLTWVVLVALVVGKTVGVGAFGLLAGAGGFDLPEGMTRRDLGMAGFIAALGLTVALFVAAEAYVDPALQGQAKMGALLSGGVGLLAVPVARMLGIGKRREDDPSPTSPPHDSSPQGVDDR